MAQGMKRAFYMKTEAVRLLKHLCACEQAAPNYASRDPFVHEQIRLIALRGGVGLPVGNMKLAVAAELVRQDWAVWAKQTSGRDILVASEAGWAKFRRLAAEPADAYQSQHRSLRVVASEEGGEQGCVKLNDAESPLAWLHRRKGRNGQPLLDAVCFAAGERLRRDLTLAQFMPRISANWEAAIVDGRRSDHGLNPTEAMLAARQRADKALSALGPELAGLLIDVCGFLKGLDVIERERGWPARSAKVVLELALRRLADHYGMAAEARGPDAGRGLRHWGGSDYRPAFDRDG